MCVTHRSAPTNRGPIVAFCAIPHQLSYLPRPGLVCKANTAFLDSDLHLSCGLRAWQPTSTLAAALDGGGRSGHAEEFAPLRAHEQPAGRLGDATAALLLAGLRKAPADRVALGVHGLLPHASVGEGASVHIRGKMKHGVAQMHADIADCLVQEVLSGQGFQYLRAR